MRKALPLTVSLLLLSSVCLTLGACGQKGPLYLPSDPPPSQRPPRDTAPAEQSAPADAGSPAPATTSPSQ